METPSDPWWSRTATEVLASIGSRPGGLSAAEADERLARFGPNRIRGTSRTSAPRLLLRQFESPLVLILVFAALVSLLVREWTEAAIILAIVAGSTTLSFLQEHRAAVALDALRRRLAIRTTVLRDGARRDIPSEAVVPGDIVLLSAGNLVPADGIVLDARDFLVAQAALTGESLPVEKRPGTSRPDASLTERTNVAFLGTSVRSGTATLLVTATGFETAFGAVAARLEVAEPETDFERGVRRFGYLLTRIMMIVVTLVLSANILLERPLMDSLLFSVALAVGLTPELLPAIVSITMAAGARRMAAHGVVVRRTSAIENLGSADVVCTDKTGTLTLGVVELSAALAPDRSASDRVFGLARINAALESGIENPLDAAILAAAASREGAGDALPSKVDEIPYDFVRKRLTIVVDIEGEDDHLIVTKGAFDTVVSCCSQVAGGTGPRALDPAAREALSAFVAGKGAEGYRVLGVATRRLPPRARYDAGDETDMVFEGFLLFYDPLKPGIAETLGSLRALGLSVKVITGDNRHVARHIATAAGLGDTLLTGADLNRTRDEALWHLAETTDIFAEVDPQQKERLVRALQARGHSVAYIGDGINDAPALRAADVGISVDRAVDVARDSADIVLLDSDLGILTQGIVDGRRTFANTLKYISITTSANFGNMISLAIGTLYLPFLPLLPAQILLNNFLSDLPSLAIATDRVDAGLVATGPRWDIAGIRRFMIVFGLISTAFDLVAFFILSGLLGTGEALFQTTWFVISLLTEIAVVLVLRTRAPAWSGRPGRLLLVSTALVGIVALGAPYLGPVSAAFGFVPLPPALLLTSFAVVTAYIATTEIAKRLFHGRQRPGP